MSDTFEEEIDGAEARRRIPEAKMKESIYGDIKEINITGLSSLGMRPPDWSEVNHHTIEEGIRTAIQEIEGEAYSSGWAAQVDDIEDDIVEMFNPNNDREQSVIVAWVWMIAKEEAENS